nr:B3 domain-containing protein Os01g0234100-like [Ipomoea batatas]
MQKRWFSAFLWNTKTPTDGCGSPLQVKSPTLIRAEEVQSSLGQEYPTFLKLLVRSHVGSCFWMGLPVPFCKKYLSRKDTTVVVENESGEEFEIKYIAEKTGLSAGWRKFVAAHKLVEGDVLIFQLTGPDRFKVYVIRTNDLTDVDGALSLLNLEVLTKQSDADALRACKLTTARTEFEVWDKSLKSFELLGMNVGFLRDRVRHLLNLAFDSEGASDAKRYWEAKTGLACTEEEIKTIEIKLVELKEASKVYSADIEALRSKAESFELMFDEEINVPW